MREHFKRNSIAVAVIVDDLGWDFGPEENRETYDILMLFKPLTGETCETAPVGHIYWLWNDLAAMFVRSGGMSFGKYSSLNNRVYFTLNGLMDYDASILNAASFKLYEYIKEKFGSIGNVPKGLRSAFNALEYTRRKAGGIRAKELTKATIEEFLAKK